MNTEQLQHTLEKHKLWLRDKGGQRADLRGANLYGANLYRADLYRADLSEADLSEAMVRLERAAQSIEAELSRAAAE